MKTRMPETQGQAHQVASHYDELDELYRDVWGEHLHHGLWLNPKHSLSEAVEALIEFVVTPLDMKDGLRVVDVGCGYGATLRYLRSKHKIKGVGYTLSERQKNWAEQKKAAGDGLSFVTQDWLKNNLPSESQDIVLSIESFSHIENPRLFLEQARRVLKPGGRLVICDWLWSEKPLALSERLLRRPICEEGRLAQLTTMNEYEKLLKEAQFSVFEQKDVSPYVKKTWRLCCRHLVKKAFTDSQLTNYLLNSSHKNRSFIKTPFRLMLAAELKQFRYGVLWARKVQ